MVLDTPVYRNSCCFQADTLYLVSSGTTTN